MRAIAAFALIAVVIALPHRAYGATGETIHAFVEHGAFFSLESHQPQLIDPQVFVARADAPAGTGPQDIVHVAGYRPALFTDNAASPAFTADGRPLGVSLGAWLGARGTLVIDMSLPASPRIRATFNGLIPRGVYSLFENHFSESGVTSTPLDGFGTNNTFTADPQGRGDITVSLRGPLTHAQAVLLVYHSDGAAHGMQRGQPGIDVHHQLIYRP